MPKRQKLDPSGGLGDVNPQFLSATTTMTVANTFFEQTLGIPVNRMPTQDGTATVMEILRIWVDMPDPTVADLGNVAQTLHNAVFSICTVSQGTVQFTLGNTRSLLVVNKGMTQAWTAAGSSTQTALVDPSIYDFTDGQGHGVLVATDNLFIGCNTAGIATAPGFAWKILYRWKRVSLAEYIGIVQSQQ